MISILENIIHKKLKLFSKPKFFICIVLTTIGIASYFYWQEHFTFAALQAGENYLTTIHTEFPILFPIGFFMFYVALTGIALPGSALLTMTAGWLFSITTGTLISSFASTIGATISFLLSRYLFRNWIQKKFKQQWHNINQQFTKNQFLFLFTIRLVPAFPFFLTNWLLGLTSVRILHYIVFSQLGMLPGTIVYANAGMQLSHVKSLKDVMSPNIILSFLLLAILPWIAKFIIVTISKRYKRKK